MLTILPSARAEKMFHQWMLDYGGYLALYREEVCKAIAAQIEEHGNEMFRAARDEAKGIVQKMWNHPYSKEIAQRIAELEP